MLRSTIDLIRAGLGTDASLTPADRKHILAILRNGAAPQLTPPSPPPDTTPRLIRRAETAARLSRSLRFVDKLAAAGILTKRKLPGRVRASGFLASDVDALIQGGGLDQ